MSFEKAEQLIDLATMDYAATSPDIIEVELFSMKLTGQLSWISILRRYLVVMALGNLVWEFAHIPLYTIWVTGSTGEIVFAALHCTGGDILIAVSTLVAALILFGTSRWPEHGYRRVAIAAIVFGLGYAGFSEWLNIEVRQSWAYREMMPVIPVIGVGLSPIAQWIILPILALWWAARKARTGQSAVSRSP